MLARGGAATERVVTAPNGRFVFRDLPASTYTLRAEAPGHVDDVTGLGAAGGVASVEIQGGQASARAVLRLWKQAVVTGVVLDEAGEPLIDARVRAYRRVVTRLGTLGYDAPADATTDDRGIYRLSRLKPGVYLVLVPQSQSTAPAAAADAALQSLISGQVPEGGLGAMGRGGVSPMDPRAIRVGEWRLSAGNVVPPAAGGGAMQVYRTVFYPAALSPAGAAWVTLRSGEERGGIDFALQPVLTGRVTGVVTGPAGAVAGVPIRLIPSDGRPGDPTALDVASSQTQADGTFTLLAVPPGQYRAIARRDPPPDLAANLPEELASNPLFQFAQNMQRGQARTPVYGETSVTVGAGDAASIAIAVSEGVTLAGRLEFQEGQPPAARELTRATVVLRPLDASLSGSRTVRPGTDGAFSAGGLLPGRYAVSVTLASPGGLWLVRQVTAAGRDAVTAPLVIEDRPLSDVVVTLTRSVGTIRGSVRQDSIAARGAGASPPPALLAVAVPANFADWTAYELLVERVQLVRVAPDGAFRMGPMLAGEYLIAVVDEAEIDPGRGLALLRALAAQATRLTVAPGDGNVVTLGRSRLPR
jgi:hypothetical protein